jgi:hypothetical protein
MAAGSSGNGELDEVLVETMMSKFGLERDKAITMAAFVSTMCEQTAQKSTTEATKRIEEERRKEKEEKKRKAAIPLEQLSPVARERVLVKKQKEELKAARRAEKEREKKREAMPLLDLTPAGAPASGSYFEFRSNLAMVIKANFQRWECWATTGDGKPRTEEDKQRVIEQVRDRWRNGARISAKVISDRIRDSLTDKRNHQRELMRKYLASKDVMMLTPEEIREKGPPSDGKINGECWARWIDEEIQMKYWLKKNQLTEDIKAQELQLSKEPSIDGEEKLVELRMRLSVTNRLASKVGNPPHKLIVGIARARARGTAATHRLGQGGGRRFRGDFVRAFHQLILLLLPSHPPLLPPRLLPGQCQ